MIVSARYASLGNMVVVTMQDGSEWHTDATLPPDTEIRRALAEWLAAGGVIEPFTLPALNAAAIINEHVESIARSMGYNSAAHCATYVNSTVSQWADEARAFIAWRDAVWLRVFELKTSAMPTSERKIIALLPQWNAPANPA